MRSAARPTTGRRWPSPNRAACAPSSPTATSGSASFTRATGDASRAPSTLGVAAAMYRDMDMPFWLEQAQAELVAVG